MSAKNPIITIGNTKLSEDYALTAAVFIRKWLQNKESYIGFIIESFLKNPESTQKINDPKSGKAVGAYTTVYNLFNVEESDPRKYNYFAVQHALEIGRNLSNNQLLRNKKKLDTDDSNQLSVFELLQKIILSNDERFQREAIETLSQLPSYKQYAKIVAERRLESTLEEKTRVELPSITQPGRSAQSTPSNQQANQQVQHTVKPTQAKAVTVPKTTHKAAHNVNVKPAQKQALPSIIPKAKGKWAPMSKDDESELESEEHAEGFFNALVNKKLQARAEAVQRENEILARETKANVEENKAAADETKAGLDSLSDSLSIEVQSQESQEEEAPIEARDFSHLAKEKISQENEKVVSLYVELFKKGEEGIRKVLENFLKDPGSVQHYPNFKKLLKDYHDSPKLRTTYQPLIDYVDSASKMWTMDASKANALEFMKVRARIEGEMYDIRAREQSPSLSSLPGRVTPSKVDSRASTVVDPLSQSRSPYASPEFSRSRLQTPQSTADKPKKDRPKGRG